MTGLRRRVPLMAAMIAWLIALGALLGGLSLARLLPEAHAKALAHQGICLTEGDAGAPADHGAGHGAGCVACPVGTSGPSLAPPEPLGIAEPRPVESRLHFTPRRATLIAGDMARFAYARGPPRA